MTALTPEREAEIRESAAEADADRARYGHDMGRLRPAAEVRSLLAALDATRAELAEANKRAEQLGEALDNALTRHGVALEQLEEIEGVCDAHGARSRASLACAVRLLAGESVGGETLPHARDLALLAEVRGYAHADVVARGFCENADDSVVDGLPDAERFWLALVRLLRGEG